MSDLPGVALSEPGYSLSREYTNFGVQFRLHVERSTNIRFIPVADVEWLHISEWDPVGRHRVRILESASSRYSATAARVLAEVLCLAADFCEYMDSVQADEIEAAKAKRIKRETQAAEARERREADAQARRERVAAKHDELMPLIEDRFRLKRRGYRATVFGTIKALSNTHMYTNSEKDVPMSIDIASIYWMEVKYEGDRHYTTIFDEDPNARY